MPAKYTVFYDASCNLCSTEMAVLESRDQDESLKLIDCSASSFDDTPFLVQGVDQRAMMAALHVLEDNGDWYTGVDAFAVLYRHVGIAWLAGFWGGRFTRPFTSRLYPYIAKYRFVLSKLGLQHLLFAFIRMHAEAKVTELAACRDGGCELKAAQDSKKNKPVDGNEKGAY